MIMNEGWISNSSATCTIPRNLDNDIKIPKIKSYTENWEQAKDEIKKQTLREKFKQEREEEPLDALLKKIVVFGGIAFLLVLGVLRVIIGVLACLG